VAKAQYYCAATLDGFIADTDDGIDWLTGYEGEYAGGEGRPLDGPYDEFYAEVGALVMGSATYEYVLDHGGGWPYAGKPTWVLSSRDLPRPDADDDGLRIVAAAVPDLLDELRAAAGERNIWVVGGGNVASQFADAGALDELLITVVPVVLGEGKPLFDRALPGRALQLTGTRAYANGMVELRYSLGAN